MAQIALNKPSGGQLLIQPEDGTSTETVTIPSVGVGKVLQVQHTQSEVGLTAAVGVEAVALTASITPSSSSSKIIVHFGLQLTAVDNRGTAYADSGYARIMRDGTTEVGISSLGVINNGDVRSRGYLSGNYVDSPATTSSITYTLQVRGGETFADYVDVNGDSTYTLTLMEVAA